MKKYKIYSSEELQKAIETRDELNNLISLKKEHKLVANMKVGGYTFQEILIPHYKEIWGINFNKGISVARKKLRSIGTWQKAA